MSSISVIIPTYNRKHLLEATLNCLLSQTHRAKEIIVVDDHSTDGTREWLERTYGNKLIILSTQGKGPGAARNTGLQAATGQYIKFFDSDDLMTRNMLEVQLRELEESKKGFIYSPYCYAREQEDGSWEQADPAILNYHPFPKTRSLTDWMIRGLFITIPGMLFRRELLDRVGPWRTDITASEDWDYLFRISLEEPYPAHTNECAFLYRLHGQQTTEQHFTDEERDWEKWHFLTEFYERYFKIDQSFSTWQLKLFENKLYQTLRVYPSDHPFFGPFRQQYGTLSNKIVWQYYRLVQKFGRIRTGTNWQPEHGPLRSQEQFEKYLSMIDLCE